MNRIAREALDGGRNAPAGSQHRRGRSLTGISGDRDESLDLFSRNRRSLSITTNDESDVMKKLGRISVGSVKLQKSGMDDLLGSTDGGKHDYDCARLALPCPEEKAIVSSAVPVIPKVPSTPEVHHGLVIDPLPLPPSEGHPHSEEGSTNRICQPIVEEPPEDPCPDALKNEIQASDNDIEDAFWQEDPDEIPTIKLNIEEFTINVHNYMQQNNLELQDMSKALVALTPEAASIPMPKLKNVSRLRTEHQVYELPDSHPLLAELDRREPDDPCSYLLAIWTPGETAMSTQPPEICCNSQESGSLCDRETCFSCNSTREAQAQTVRGTLLIPCRTAMRGSFPLNGTYFQVNEVFADHDSSLAPINVPRSFIWNLPRRTVYFGTSIPSIFKGLTTEGIQQCFWRGYVCVRGFDQKTRAPRPLIARLHFPASKLVKTRKAAPTNVT